MKLLNNLKSIREITKKLNTIRKKLNESIKRQDIIDFINQQLSRTNYTSYQISDNGLCFKTGNVNFDMFGINLSLLKDYQKIEITHITRYNEEISYTIEINKDRTVITEKESSTFKQSTLNHTYEYFNGWLVKETKNYINKGLCGNETIINNEAYFDTGMSQLIKKKEKIYKSKKETLHNTKYETMSFLNPINIDSKLNDDNNYSYLSLRNIFVESNENHFESVKKGLEKRKIINPQIV